MRLKTAIVAVLVLSGFVGVQAQQTGGPTMSHWGQPGDIPVPADYDGDKKLDVAIYRPSTGEWWIRITANTYDGHTVCVQWGAPGDLPVQGDYNGDGVTEIAVWRPSTGVWYIGFDLVFPFPQFAVSP